MENTDKLTVLEIAIQEKRNDPAIRELVAYLKERLDSATSHLTWADTERFTLLQGMAQEISILIKILTTDPHEVNNNE